MNSGAFPVFQTFSPEAAGISHLFVIVLVICAVILAVVIGMIGYGPIFFTTGRVPCLKRLFPDESASLPRLTRDFETTLN